MKLQADFFAIAIRPTIRRSGLLLAFLLFNSFFKVSPGLSTACRTTVSIPIHKGLADLGNPHIETRSRELKLKTGEWVEVRSKEEILATLDEARGAARRDAFHARRMLPVWWALPGLRARTNSRSPCRRPSLNTRCDAPRTALRKRRGSSPSMPSWAAAPLSIKRGHARRILRNAPESQVNEATQPLDPQTGTSV